MLGVKTSQDSENIALHLGVPNSLTAHPAEFRRYSVGVAPNQTVSLAGNKPPVTAEDAS